MTKVSRKCGRLMTPKQKRLLRRSDKEYLRLDAPVNLRCDSPSTDKPVMDSRKMETDALKENTDVPQSPLMLSPVDFCKQNHVPRTPRIPRVEGCESQLRLDPLPMSPSVGLCSRNNLLRTPRTPQADNTEAKSGLESLPIDLLAKILCNLHHDQLRPAFHVSEIIRKAAIQAWKFHFSYTTPDRTRQEMLRTTTPRPSDRWPFGRKCNGKGFCIRTPPTPKARRHGLRNLSRAKQLEMGRIPAGLFPDLAFPSRTMVPSVLCKSLVSNRVLFHEDGTQN